MTATETTNLVMNHHTSHQSWPTGHDRGWDLEPAQHRPLSPPIPGQRQPGDESVRQHPRVEVGGSLRNLVTTRLVRANFEHCRIAWERRRSDPIGPHVTIYLYGDGRHRLRLGYRLFLAADEPRLPHLLHDLIPVVAGQLRAGLDVRQAQCTAVEDGMRPGDGYFGVAVSSLDTPAGTWKQVAKRRDVYSEQHIPGRSYAWLVDDTVLVVDRHGRDRFGQVDVHANAPTQDTGYPVTLVPDLADPDRQSVADRHVLTHLRVLHQTVLTGGAAHIPTGGGQHAK